MSCTWTYSVFKFITLAVSVSSVAVVLEHIVYLNKSLEKGEFPNGKCCTWTYSVFKFWNKDFTMFKI